MAAPSKLSLPTRFRSFSLRTGLVLFLLLGITLGLIGRWIQDIRESGEAQLRLAALSSNRNWRNREPGEPLVSISYAPENEIFWATKSIRKWIHPEYQRQMERVAINGAGASLLSLARDFERSFGCEEIDISGCDEMSPQFAASLFAAKNLKSLYVQESLAGRTHIDPVLTELNRALDLEVAALRDVFVSEVLAAELANLPRLRELTIESCAPETIITLATAPSLEKLAIGGLRHSASDFRQVSEDDFGKRSRLAMKDALRLLATNPKFTSMTISGALKLQPEDLSDFCRLSQLKRLHLHSPEFSPHCIAEIAKLPNLESLTLHDFAIIDEHVPVLANAKKLKELTIGPNVSIPAVKSLREKLPQCKIERY